MWYKSKEVLIFSPSIYWGRTSFLKQAQSTNSFLTDINPVDILYNDALAELSTFHGGVAELFTEKNPGKNILGFSSLYLSSDGEYFLIPSHTHDEVSRKVLRKVNPQLPSHQNGAEKLKSGGYTHNDLTQISGIQRVQIYNDGMGITIEMSNPPNIKQLNAIKDAYEMTTQKHFVAEVVLNNELITHLTFFRQLVYFVNNFDPEHPESMEEINPRLSDLFT